MEQPFLLTGKTILISGASSGIGRAISIFAARFGANLILLGRNESRLMETKAALSGEGKHLIFTADLQVVDSYHLLEKFLKENEVILNGMVHAAGISPTLALRSVTADKFNAAFDTNVKAGIFLAKLVCKPAFASKSGMSIVFLASVMASVGSTGKSLYGMTKAALVAAAKNLALEYAPKKIRFNTISPGVVLTPMSLSSVYSNDPAAMVAVEALHPLGFGQPEDIAGAAIFLLSDGSRWITGTDLTVDGGYTAK